ncbi:MAG: hypothetical protein DRJ42_16255 [Deltaproteobacteria bacterium]|nr:MAG: hypothetical protein DRJ42_16255 [Deltaproteobacteria bacterium]
MSPPALRSLATLCVLLAACGADDSPTDASTPGDASTDGSAPSDTGAADDAADDASVAPAPFFLGPEDRRARLVAPAAHDGVTPLPLVFLLHGYTANSTLQDALLGSTSAAHSRGFYLVLPEGTVDARGNQFWNATNFCCDFNGSGVDDVAYLTSLLDEAEAVLPVDTARVYFTGHSNGGYMSYRMACELSSRITAIASLAGSDYKEDYQCEPTEGVSVLQIHGTADATVLYGGNFAYPSATDVVARWAGRAGCDPATITDLDAIDVDTAIPGAETTRQRWQTGCEPGLDAELWSITAGGHIPVLDARAYGGLIADWLLTHVK